ncbi:MAG: phage tail tape measure protein, partial [Rhodocyclaceae bacterium]|nr:phage tail tape measure protein [Rhodocyclaceae bacterium]
MSGDLQYGIRLKADASGATAELKRFEQAVNSAGDSVRRQAAAIGQTAARTVTRDLEGAISPLAKGFGDLDREMSRFIPSFGSLRSAAQESVASFSEMASNSRLVALAVGTTAGAAGLAATAWVGYQAAQVAAAVSTANVADEIGKMAQRTGIGAEALSALRHQAALSDVSANELGLALRNLANRMQDAVRGSGGAAETFRAMGISVRDSNGQLKGTDQILAEVAQRFSTYRDSAEKTALAVDLFGRAGERMIPMLNGGTAGMREAAAEARRLGVVFSESLAKEAERFNDNMKRLQTGVEGARIALGGPMISTLADLTEHMLRAHREGGRLQAMLTGIGAAVVHLGGGEINPLKMADQGANEAFKSLASAQKQLQDMEAASANRARERAISGPPGIVGLIRDDYASSQLDAQRQKVADMRMELSAWVRERNSLLPKAKDDPTATAPVPPKPGKAGRGREADENNDISRVQAKVYANLYQE